MNAELEAIYLHIIRFIILSTLIFFPSVNGVYSADYSVLPEQLWIKSIDGMRVTESKGLLQVVITIINEGKKPVKIERGGFKVVVNPDGVRPKSYNNLIEKLNREDKITMPDSRLNLGYTKPLNFEVPECSDYRENGRCNKPGETSFLAEIELPRATKQRKYLIYKLLNYIGLPGSNKKTVLVGEVEVGVKENGHWNMFPSKVLLELYFFPRIQSESIFISW